MKTLLIIVGMALGPVASLRAQNFAIDWFTLDGGGGTSTGGLYAVSGTIGQPDAGAMTGGSYSLAGGFWGAFVPVTTPGSPMLYITNLLSGTAKIAWAPNTPGFVLQEAATLNLASVPWTNAPAAYTNGAIIPASMQTRYFRLIKP